MTFNDEKNLKKLLKYECKLCDFKSVNKNDLTRHCKTIKHNLMINDDNNNIKTSKIIHTCKCGKIYKFKQGLFVHKKKCNYKEENNKSIEKNNKEDYKELVFKLITENQEFKKEMFKENQELRKQISELIPRVGNNNNNNIKNKFNINVFLNEKCKDALSMDEFIDKIEVTMKNLLTTKDKGLGQGLSNIIIDNINKLSLYERPMHCTDKKRETLYVKNNECEKDEKKEQISKLLNRVEEKQMKNIKKWTRKHPNYQTDNNLQKEYMDLVKSCTTSIEECKEKTIKNVCDILYIEKEYI